VGSPTAPIPSLLGDMIATCAGHEGVGNWHWRCGLVIAAAVLHFDGRTLQRNGAWSFQLFNSLKINFLLNYI